MPALCEAWLNTFAEIVELRSDCRMSGVSAVERCILTACKNSQWMSQKRS